MSNPEALYTPIVIFGYYHRVLNNGMGTGFHRVGFIIMKEMRQLLGSYCDRLRKGPKSKAGQVIHSLKMFS